MTVDFLLVSCFMAWKATATDNPAAVHPTFFVDWVGPCRLADYDINLLDDGGTSMPKARKKARKKVARKVVKKVRCMAKTKDGKKCKRMVAPPAKVCHLHKK